MQNKNMRSGLFEGCEVDAIEPVMLGLSELAVLELKGCPITRRNGKLELDTDNYEYKKVQYATKDSFIMWWRLKYRYDNS